MGGGSIRGIGYADCIEALRIGYHPALLDEPCGVIADVLYARADAPASNNPLAANPHILEGVI